MNRQFAVVLLGFLVLAGWHLPAQAAVTANKGGGFIITHTATLPATPAQVWALLLRPSQWWSQAHTWSGNAANLSLNAAPGGCFCETLPNGGFVEHARIIYAAPGAMLRLSGGLGPLQGEAISGTLTIALTAAGDGQTTLTFTYVVGGHAQFDPSAIAPAVDGVIGEQHTRLVKLITTGKAGD
jgi:uncharacterized protein YndB with AHSA1/START domain